MGASVFPMGVTKYDPEKAWSGYTLMPVNGVGAVLIDMNGNVVRTWTDLQGFPNKLLPGGQVLGSLGRRENQYGYQDMSDLTQVDWDGNIVWSFNKKEQLKDGDKEYWLARQHHDYQREGNPVGYYVPGMECRTDGGNTLILCHEDKYKKNISDKRLLDDCFIEVDWEGNILWKWCVSDHFRELDFDETAKNVLFRNPNYHPNGGGQSDWMHINSMSVLGPNRWYDAGDERFHPDNIIWDARESNILAIISKKTGKIVWKIGPDFTKTKELRAIGQIIGQHHVHMIPKGLPGEGNILIFDNGGWAGYGAPSRTSKDGTKTDIRDHSRVIELDPVTLKVVWEFDGSIWPGMMGITSKSKFYSQLISSAQRLPNGNTLIDEGCSSRILEVTPEKEVVWEYIAPFRVEGAHIYRAYRYPYSYVPQLPTPTETPVIPVDNHEFRVPGAAEGFAANRVSVAGTWGYEGKMDACVTEDQIHDGDEEEIKAAF
ncbi:aryl-sulfate sulfotransferase [Clostridium sp. AN503]|uniref:aryl-sulfate sulfotransferase n=1 Tax=Clostridium sp. AN503 TaxID=3160598 RepID=UPI0034588268